MECCDPDTGTAEAPADDPASNWEPLRFGIAGLLAGNAMVVGLAINLSTLAWNVRLFIEIALLGSTLIVFELLGGRLLAKARRAVRRREVTFEFLFLAGILGALGMSVFSMIRGRGPVYFEIASILLVVYAAGDRIGEISRTRGMEAARAWQVDDREVRQLTSCGHTRRVPLEDIEPGDKVVVQPDETVPVDGTISSGEGFVRDAHVTGEWVSTVKRPGDSVYAGSEALDARFVVETDAAPGDRLIDSIRASVQAAWEEPSEWQVEANEIVQWFFPAVVAATAATFGYWSWTAGWETGLFNALSVLLIACPCALGFAVPLAVWITLGAYADDGLIAERGDVVERLSRCDTVLFDKTGTLTAGTAQLVDFVVDDAPTPSPWARRELLALAETLERSSQHPIAEAFTGQVADTDLADDLKLLESRPIPGAGLEGDVRDETAGRTREVVVGTDAVVPETESGCFERLADRLRARDGTRCLAVVVDGRVVAAAAVAERPADHIDRTLASLADQGRATGLVTGDGRERAERLGFEHVYAEMHPDDKQQLVCDLQGRGRSVLFVGDGVNDASAMAEADVAIAKSQGSELTVDVADATWRGNSPRVLADALDDADRAVSMIRSNLGYAAAYNLAGIGAAAAGFLHPVAAAVLMVGSSLFVTWRTALSLDTADRRRPTTA